MPTPVDKYFKEVREGNPDYSEEQAWATAWSIFCKHKDPGSEHCSKEPGEYLKGKSAGLVYRVASRHLEAMEHATPEARKKYLHEHPGANPANHTVHKSEGHGGGHGGGHGEKKEEPKKKTPEEETAETAEKMKPVERKLAEKVKGWGAKAMAFIKSAPANTKRFVADEKYRRDTLMEAHKAFTEAPEKVVHQAMHTMKEEVHEYKEAGAGIKAVLKGGKMSDHEKKAFKTVATHLAIGIAAAALTASGPLAGAAAFGKGMARHVAAKAVSNALGHLHVLDEIGHIGHGVKHLMEHFASDGSSPELVLARYIQAAKDGKAVDSDEVMGNFIAAAVAKEMTRVSDADVKAAAESMDEDEPKKDDKKAALRVMARYQAV